MIELALKMDIDEDDNNANQKCILLCHPEQGAWLQELWAEGVSSLNAVHTMFDFHGDSK